MTEWSSVISEAVANVQQLGTEIQADPLPVLAEVISNQLDVRPDDRHQPVRSLASGLNTLITEELPGQFQTLFSGIEAGDISTSVNNFTTGLLVDLLPGASSLVNIFDIPGDIGQNLANVLTDNVPNVGLETLLAPIGILFWHFAGIGRWLASDRRRRRCRAERPGVHRFAEFAGVRDERFPQRVAT